MSAFLNDVFLAMIDRHEQRCLRCGRCCGRDSDPCEHLIENKDGTFACAVYENRLGWHKTVSGRSFRCVPIEEVMRNGYLPPGCGYGAGI